LTLRAEGISSAYAIAKALDAAGITTRRQMGCPEVIIVLQRLTDDPSSSGAFATRTDPLAADSPGGTIRVV
jgi:hypothetical protein